MLDSALNCFRIGVPQWLREERFSDLLDVLERHRAADEVTFFTSETHPPLPLDVMLSRAELLQERMAHVRERGFGTGINILSTIGHHEENLPYSLDGPYTRITDIEGRVSRGVFCPNDERFIDEYVVPVYVALAKANPDYIWIDDDVRLLGHMPISATCFCDHCLSRFAERTGRSWNCATLREAFAAENAEALTLRKKWLAANRETISRLFRTIEATVHRIDSRIELGFMTGERYFEGYAFEEWAHDLAGPCGAGVRWRPGGGTYTDGRLDDITDKAHDIGRQIALLPQSVTVIQSEIESFPYQRLKKSRRATTLEAAAYIAAGCTGAAYNVLSMYDEPLDEYESLVEELAKEKPFLDELVRAVGRTHLTGVAVAWTKDASAACNYGRDWTPGAAPGMRYANELWQTGLPAAYLPVTIANLGQVPVVALSGESVRSMNEPTIRALLSGGVYMDADALNALNELGWAEQTGFSIGREWSADCIEKFADHPLNGQFCGRERDARQSFWPGVAHELLPANRAEVVAGLVDYSRNTVAECCLGVFENTLGGRICVAGYSAWAFLQNTSTASRTKSIMRWLSRDRLPGYIESFHRMNLWVRTDESGSISAIVLNASLDAAEGVRIALCTQSDRLRIVSRDGGISEVISDSWDGFYRQFVLPRMEAWGMVVVGT